jgi:hypothetical protein
LFADRSSKDEKIVLRTFMKPPKYERGGRLKVKIHVFLMKIAHDHGTDIIQLSVEFSKHLSK